MAKWPCATQTLGSYTNHTITCLLGATRQDAGFHTIAGSNMPRDEAGSEHQSQRAVPDAESMGESVVETTSEGPKPRADGNGSIRATDARQGNYETRAKEERALPDGENRKIEVKRTSASVARAERTLGAPARMRGSLIAHNMEPMQRISSVSSTLSYEERIQRKMEQGAVGRRSARKSPRPDHVRSETPTEELARGKIRPTLPPPSKPGAVAVRGSIIDRNLEPLNPGMHLSISSSVDGGSSYEDRVQRKMAQSVAATSRRRARGNNVPPRPRSRSPRPSTSNKTHRTTSPATKRVSLVDQNSEPFDPDQDSTHSVESYESRIQRKLDQDSHRQSRSDRFNQIPTSPRSRSPKTPPNERVSPTTTAPGAVVVRGSTIVEHSSEPFQRQDSGDSSTSHESRIQRKLDRESNRRERAARISTSPPRQRSRSPVRPPAKKAVSPSKVPGAVAMRGSIIDYNPEPFSQEIEDESSRSTRSYESRIQRKLDHVPRMRGSADHIGRAVSRSPRTSPIPHRSRSPMTAPASLPGAFSDSNSLGPGISSNNSTSSHSSRFRRKIAMATHFGVVEYPASPHNANQNVTTIGLPRTPMSPNSRPHNFMDNFIEDVPSRSSSPSTLRPQHAISADSAHKRASIISNLSEPEYDDYDESSQLSLEGDAQQKIIVGARPRERMNQIPDRENFRNNPVFLASTGDLKLEPPSTESVDDRSTFEECDDFTGCIARKVAREDRQARTASNERQNTAEDRRRVIQKKLDDLRRMDERAELERNEDKPKSYTEDAPEALAISSVRMSKKDKYETEGTLAIATAINEDDLDEDFFPKAYEYDPSAKPPLFQNRRVRFYALLGCCILVIVSIATVVLIVINSPTESEQIFLTVSPTPAPTSQPTSTATNLFREIISKETNSDLVYETGTAHALAADWLVEENFKSIDDPNLIQRYAMTLLYFQFSANGQLPWKSCNPPLANETNQCSHSAPVRPFDPESPTVLYTNQTRWLTKTDECTWLGVLCSEGASSVIALDLRVLGLAGNMTADFALLPFLQIIRLQFNEIEGTIPPELGELKHLIGLTLHNNMLTGTVPESLWTGDFQLRGLNIGGNLLSGTISSNIGLQLELQSFFCFDNVFSGSLPNEFFDNSRILQARFNGNQFTGTIPDAALPLVSELWLHDNRLIGSIPVSVGSLTALTELELSGNMMSGFIPEAIFELTKLTNLALHQNKLTGTLPDSIGNLTELRAIQVTGNQLTGAIPDILWEMTTLVVIRLGLTALEGSVPREICGRRSLFNLEADCRPVDNPPIPCSCCHVCCSRISGICATN